MKLPIIKFSLLLFLIYACFNVTVKPVSAFIPDIEGSVKVAGTNAPVPNVWVQLRDAGKCGEYQYRYAKTDNNGRYTFYGWTQGGSDAVGENKPIDTNLDGSNDAIMHPTKDLCDPDDTPGSIFGCGRDPFMLTVVKPKNWSGSFDTIGQDKGGGCNYCVNNSTIAPIVETIYYRSGTPPTVTPTGIPTNTPSPTETPAPSPTSCPLVTSSIPPIADAEVRKISPNTNFGNLPQAETSNISTDEKSIYMKFDLTGLTGQIVQDAKLNLFSTTNSIITANIMEVPNSVWDENTINYTNKPTPTILIGSFSGSTTGAYKQVDLTNFVNNNIGNIVTISILTTDTLNTGMIFNSKEAADNAPFISIITTCFVPLPTSTPTPSPTPVLYAIQGVLFHDTNKNGIKEPFEQNYTQKLSLNLTGAETKTTISNSSGNYIFTDLTPGDTYTVNLMAPSSETLTTPNPVTVTLGSSSVINFGILSGNVITGNVFIDLNNNLVKDESEANYNGTINITSSAGLVTTTLDGRYAINNLIPGTYTVSYNSLPDGFKMLFPLNGPPPSYTVTIGSSCSTNTTTGSQCNINGDIVNLNFAITDSIPWIQGTGLNMRFDYGVNNYIAANPACSGSYMSTPGTTTNSGIIFSGNNASNFGKGKASSDNWVVGNSSYPEVFSTSKPLASSYESLLANLNKSGNTINNLSNFCNLNNCTLPNNLASGAYRTNGDLILNGYRFRNNANFIFLINGDLTITGNIEVPNHSTALFSAKSDIYVDENTGSIPACNLTANLQGFYSADNNITIQGINNCTIGSDKMLIFEGAIFVNASLSGGVFKNNRNLCMNNYSYPSILFKERLDFIFNAPKLIKNKNLNFKEEAP